MEVEGGRGRGRAKRMSVEDRQWSEGDNSEGLITPGAVNSSKRFGGALYFIHERTASWAIFLKFIFLGVLCGNGYML